jgi:hypothetical protein
MFSPYDAMKPKMKKQFDELNHFDTLYNVLVSMFDYRGLPDTLRPEFIEGLMITQGTCGVMEYDGKLYTGPGGYCGNVYNFLPQEYQITVTGINSSSLRGRVNEKVAVGWNNATMHPDLLLMQYAATLTEVDVSERVNLIFSRFLRIPKVKDQKEKSAVEESVKAIMDGRFSAIVSDNIREILTETDKDNKFLDLVDVKEVDKLQYLNQYRDNIIKRFFQIYGQGMQSTAKLAQQTNDELHGNDTVSMIIPYQRLYYRKKFVEDINRLFDTNISVEFSEAWKQSEREAGGEENDNNNKQDTDGDTADNSGDAPGGDNQSDV